MRAMPLVSVFVCVAAFGLFAAAPCLAASDPAAYANVRPLDDTAALFLRFGAGESERFRDIVRALERSNVIVYVEVREEGAHPVGGGLTFLGQTNGVRWVRATVHSGTSSRSRTFQDIIRLTAILGHELHHAVEASEAASLDDVYEFEQYFRSIGVKERSHVLDTLGARDAGRHVEAELRGLAHRRPTAGQGPLAAAAP